MFESVRCIRKSRNKAKELEQRGELAAIDRFQGDRPRSRIGGGEKRKRIRVATQQEAKKETEKEKSFFIQFGERNEFAADV